MIENYTLWKTETLMGNEFLLETRSDDDLFPRNSKTSTNIFIPSKT